MINSVVTGFVNQYFLILVLNFQPYIQFFATATS
jgi:hypothetical protein